MPQAWPSDRDLEQFLRELGLLTGSLPASAEGLCAAAARELELETGFSPFVAAGAPEERELTLPGGSRTLPLRGGAVEIREVLERNSEGDWVPVNPEGAWAARPADARARDRPFTWIEFCSPRSQVDEQLRVSARWGYLDGLREDPIPFDLYHAVLRRAAWQSISVVTSGHGVVTSIQQDAVRFTFGETTSEAAGGPGTWLSTWQDTIRRYRLGSI